MECILTLAPSRIFQSFIFITDEVLIDPRLRGSFHTPVRTTQNTRQDWGAAVATCGSRPVSLQSCGRRRSWPGSRRSTGGPKPRERAIETKPLDDWQPPIRADSGLRCWGWRPWRASRKPALPSANSFDCCLLSWTATGVKQPEPAWVQPSCPADCCAHTSKCLDWLCRCDKLERNFLVYMDRRRTFQPAKRRRESLHAPFALLLLAHTNERKKKTGLILLMWLGGARSCDFIRSTKKVHNIGTMIDWWIHFFLSIIALIFFQQVFSVVGLAEKW